MKRGVELHPPLSQSYMGISEIARYRGVTKQAVVNWRVRDKLPAPVALLKMGPIWRTKDITSHFEGSLGRVGNKS